MTSAKSQPPFLSVLYTSGALVLAGFALSGMEAAQASELPMVERPVSQEPDSAADAVVLADRLAQRESADLLLDPVRRDRLIREIGQVLARTRDAYPVVAEISARQDYESGTLLLGLELDLLKAVSGLEQHKPIAAYTGYAEFDALNAKLGLPGVQLFRHAGVLALHFSGLVNLEAACRAYQKIPGVRFAEPDTRLVDGPDLEVLKLGGTWYVVARKAWGDCPSGCIHEELLFFTVENGGVSRVEASQAMDRAGFARLVADRGWR